MRLKKKFSKQSLQLLKPFLSKFDIGWEIELIIMMHNGRDRSWSALELSQQLQIDQAAVVRSLANLEENELIISRDNRYLYSPRNSEKHALVELTISAFAQRKLEVIRTIYESE